MRVKEIVPSINVDMYQAYLIRLWRDGQQADWRASAQSVQSGKIFHFPNLAQLFAFLETQTEAGEPSDGHP